MLAPGPGRHADAPTRASVGKADRRAASRPLRSVRCGPRPGALESRSVDGHRSGLVAILSAMAVLSLFVIGVALHPESARGPGRSLLVMDAVLVLLFGGVGVWAVRQRSLRVSASLRVGASAGLALGAAHVAHHAAEFLAPVEGRTALLLLGAGHMLLVFALFCAAGSAAWERTDSIPLAPVAGAWSAMLSVLILIAFGLASNLVFESRAALRLHEAFLGSGMSDPGAFVVRNALEAASEALSRFPILALPLSLGGGLANAWLSRRRRRTVLIAAWFMPIVFTVGALSLWHADSLERAARPPFVISGLLLAAVSLSGVHGVWSALRRAT